MSTGYSGTPLARKLGIKEGMRLLVLNAPAGYNGTLGQLPPGVQLASAARGSFDLAQLFVTRRNELERRVPVMQRALREKGALWISWPKKTSNIETEVNGDVLREVLLPTGWVDVKVCAVDDTWSGLKFLRRVKPSGRADRPTAKEAKRQPKAR